MAKVVTSLVSNAPRFVKGVVDSSKPRLATFMKYARVELVPPAPGEFGQVAQGFGKLIHSAKTGAWKNVTVREGWLNTLITMEIAFWFFVGECIGKRSIIAYQV